MAPPPAAAHPTAALRRGRPLQQLLLHLQLLLLLLACALPSTIAAVTCAPQVLADCPLKQLIPFKEFSLAFPVIEYCMGPERGFVPVEREACEAFGLGKWTVRPGE